MDPVACQAGAVESDVTVYESISNNSSSEHTYETIDRYREQQYDNRNWNRNASTTEVRQ